MSNEQVERRKARAKQITEAVLGAIEADRRAADQRGGSTKRLFRKAKPVIDNLGRAGLLLGVILVLLGFALYRINPKSVLDKAVSDYIETQNREELVRGHINLGTTFLRTDAFEAANSEFEDALNLDPTNPEAQGGLFKVRLFESISRKDYDPSVAEKRLEFLISQDRRDAAAHTFRGDLHLQSGEYDLALREYGTALKSDPSFAHARLGEGNVYDLQGKLRKALGAYMGAVKLAPSNQIYLNNVAYQRFRLGDYRGALVDYDRLQRLDVRFMLPYYVAAAAYRLLDELRISQLYQEAVLKLLKDPNARSLGRNQTSWFFHTTEPGAPAAAFYLTNYAAKTYYARLSLALTAYLLGNEHRSRQEIVRARRLVLDPADRDAVRRIILFDVALLGRKTTHGPAAERFVQTLLSAPVVTPFIQKLVKAKAGELAYVPTRVPLGYRFRSQEWKPSTETLKLRFATQTQQPLVFTAVRFRGPFASCGESSQRTFQVDGNRIFWDGTSAWRCQRTTAGGIVELLANGPDLSRVALGRVVASGKRVTLGGA
jgi:tetratricopeptide (TPR) repeat protein